jgi:PHD/YefM family antitoxin component YafN of YafNO toxin-antitoxin module
MTDVLTVRATEFSRNFAKYQDDAIEAKVINITSHGRVVGGYLSASELARYEEMKRRERKVLIVGELDDDTLSAIETAEYGVAPK